jgi:hypothetical protein
MTRLTLSASSMFLMATSVLADGFGPAPTATSLSTLTATLPGMVLAASPQEVSPAPPFVPGGTPTGNSQQGPAANVFSFKGIKLGMHGSQIDKSLTCSVNGSLTPLERRCEYRACADAAALISGLLTGETDTVAGVPVALTYSFSNAKTFIGSILYTLVGNFDPAKFGTVKRAFLDRYGTPTKVDPIEVHDRRGVRFSGELIYWQKDDQFLVLSQYDDKQGTSDEWDLRQSYFAMIDSKEFGRVQQCIRSDF